MKTTFYFCSMALLAIGIASCQKEQINPTEKGFSLEATIEEHQPVTKTSINENNSVVWSENDAINVFTDATENIKFTLTSGAGQTSCSFNCSDELTGAPQYAIYPYNATNSIDGSVITFTLPEEQNYVAGTFDNGANVAVAKVNGSSLAFKNTCGILHLQIKGAYQVDRIELTSKGGEYLNGTFSVDANGANPAVHVDGGTNKITLRCNGLWLDGTAATDFYFVVPAGSLSGGFDAVVYDMVGGEYYRTVSTSNSQTIARSVIRKMPEVVVSYLDDIDALKEVTFVYVYSTGRFISLRGDYGFYPTSESRVQLRARCFGPGSILGVYDSGIQYRIGFKSNLYTSYYGSGNKYGSVNDKTLAVYDFYKGVLTRDGIIVAKVTDSVCSEKFELTLPCTIGCVQTNNGVTDSSGVTIFSMIVWESGVLSHYYIPCKLKQNLSNTFSGYGRNLQAEDTGLYDLVTRKIYTNYYGSGQIQYSLEAGQEL